MKIMACTMAVTFLLTFPQAALALAFETFGNDLVNNQPDWVEGVVDVVNLKTRVYSMWADGMHYFFYRGGAPAVNETLRKYAAVRADAHQVILLPGSGKTKSFDGQPIAFDCQLDVPVGRYLGKYKGKNPVMTVYIHGTKPRPLEPKQVEKWLADLNSELFKTRDKANRELQKLGNDAKPFLRAALKPGATLEARRRIEALLEKLRELDVTDLEMPKGVTVISVYDLLAAGLQNIKDADSRVRRVAAWDLCSLAPYSEHVVPALADLLKNDKDRFVRQAAANSLGGAAIQTTSALAVLKEGLEDQDVFVRSACQEALERIDNTKDTPEQQERRRRELAIAKEINEFKTGGGTR
jgi:hypothetical protein